MIAKWLGLIEAGRIAASGGGSIPLGDATVWNSITNWTDFGTIPGPLRNGDLVPVTDLLPGFGIAQYNGSDWELRQALFATKADLEAFPELVGTGAIAIVGTGVETDPIYYSDGTTWFRTPDGTRYIYPNELDWASLPTEDTIKADDEAVVASLGLGNAYGRAVYDGTDWLLSRAWFDSVADMTAFPELKSVGALASVEQSASDDENAVRYQWNGSAWARTAALTAGYAWTITSLSQADPSGVGATQVGDYGTFTDPITGAINVYRLATINIASGAGSGTVTRWIPEDVYGRANLQVVAYCVGDEAMPGYGMSLRGYTYERTGAGTIGTVSGYMRLDAPAPGSGSQFAYMTGPNIIGSKRFYVVSDARGVTAGTVGQAGFFNSSLVPQSQWTLAEQRDQGSTMRPIFWDGFIWAPATTSVRNGTGNTLSASDPWIIEGWSAGTAITDMMVTRVNGQVYTSLVRNFDAATVSTNFNVLPFAGGNSFGTSSARFEIRNHYVMTYD